MGLTIKADPMTQDEIFAECEEALETSRKAKVEALDAELRARNVLELAKLRLKYQKTKPETKPKKQRKTKIQKFIDRFNPASDVVQFLSTSEGSTSEVAEFLEVTPETVSKRLRNGDYRPGASDSKGKRWIEKLSVVESFYNAGTEKSKIRELDDLDRP